MNPVLSSRDASHVIIVGAGFTGLAAAYELAQAGVRATVLEADAGVGGLAGSFEVEGQALEKFYHHWFTNDRYLLDLVHELGREDEVVFRPSQTGMYYANRLFRLSRPLDVLRFSPLSLPGRLRLGLLVLQARRIKDWKALEAVPAADWLRRLCGEEVYRIVWRPLLEGKFGRYAKDVSASWMWKKLVLRGGSRGRQGREELAYYKGGFAALARVLAHAVRDGGGAVHTGTPVTDLCVEDGRVTGVRTPAGAFSGDAVLLTPALPIAADLLAPYTPAAYASSLRQIDYLANVCLVLELDRSLSDTYWLNVNDPGFPFVGVIEHTNFEPPSSYGGRHIVYLSRYLPPDDPLYEKGPSEVLAFSVPHLQRMFPAFQREWILRSHVWKARYAQPLVTCRYSERIPPRETPVEGVYIASMAQVYPEDRGTNYAIRDGRAVARTIAERIGVTP